MPEPAPATTSSGPSVREDGLALRRIEAGEVALGGRRRSRADASRRYGLRYYQRTVSSTCARLAAQLPTPAHPPRRYFPLGRDARRPPLSTRDEPGRARQSVDLPYVWAAALEHASLRRAGSVFDRPERLGVHRSAARSMCLDGHRRRLPGDHSVSLDVDDSSATRRGREKGDGATPSATARTELGHPRAQCARAGAYVCSTSLRLARGAQRGARGSARRQTRIERLVMSSRSSTRSARPSKTASSGRSGRRPSRAATISGCSKAPCTLIPSTAPCTKPRPPGSASATGARRRGLAVADLVAANRLFRRAPATAQAAARTRPRRTPSASSARTSSVTGSSPRPTRSRRPPRPDRRSLRRASAGRRRCRAPACPGAPRLRSRSSSPVRRSQTRSAETCFDPGRTTRSAPVEIRGLPRPDEVRRPAPGASARRGSTPSDTAPPQPGARPGRAAAAQPRPRPGARARRKGADRRTPFRSPARAPRARARAARSSPRNLFSTNPRMSRRVSSVTSAHVPWRCAKAPPRSMSATSTTGASAACADAHVRRGPWSADSSRPGFPRPRAARARTRRAAPERVRGDGPERRRAVAPRRCG